MAYRHRYVDPDATGTPEDGTTWAKAYPSLNAAEQAEDNSGDIRATGGSNEIVVFHCRSSAGTADTTASTISGWTTDAGGYIIVVADAVNTSYGGGASETTGTGRHEGVWSDSKYRIVVTNGNAVLVGEDYIHFDGLQIGKGGTNANVQACIGTTAITATNNHLRVSNCLLKQPGNASYQEPGLYVNDVDHVVDVWNTIVYGVSTSTGTASACLYLNCASANVVNCTLVGGLYGVKQVNGTVTAKNTYGAPSVGGGGAFFGTITQTACAASDTTAADAALDNIAYDTTEGAGHAGFTNVTPGSEDFALKAGSVLVGAGTDVSGDGTVAGAGAATDILGTTRS